MKNKNKKWIKPEMARIKLNPEQAVLSCCDNVSRLIMKSWAGCMVMTCAGSPSGDYSPSS